MQPTIIIYEPVEKQSTFSLNDSYLYKTLGGDTKVKNLEFYVNFFEDFG